MEHFRGFSTDIRQHPRHRPVGHGIPLGKIAQGCAQLPVRPTVLQNVIVGGGRSNGDAIRDLQDGFGLAGKGAGINDGAEGGAFRGNILPRILQDLQYG